MKTKVYHLYDINYDTDGQEVSLPKEALVMIEESEDIEETGADIISDNTGFCVFDFKSKELMDYPEHIKLGDFLTKK